MFLVFAYNMNCVCVCCKEKNTDTNILKGMEREKEWDKKESHVIQHSFRKVCCYLESVNNKVCQHRGGEKKRLMLGEKQEQDGLRRR